MEPVLASHFHDQIVAHAFSALLPLAVGLPMVAVTGWILFKRDRRFLLPLAIGLVVAGAGFYRVAEASAMSHNHLCHNHHADSCGGGAHAADHDHRFGARTADEGRSQREARQRLGATSDPGPAPTAEPGS